MTPSLWWLFLGLALCAAEMATGTLFALWFGIGAFLTAGFAFFVEKDLYQYAFFALSSVLLVLLARPWVARLSGKTTRLANVDDLAGRSALLLEVEKGRPGAGVVKVGGEHWRAESADGAPLKAGREVVIVSVEANTLKVRPKD